MRDLGRITQGLGNFTPEVWKRLGDTLRNTETPESLVDRFGEYDIPVTFPAKLKKAKLIKEMSGDADDLCSPHRHYRYEFAQVSVRFDVVNGVTYTELEGGIKTTATNNLYAVNGAEFGQPHTRSESFLGVMLKENEYPDLVTVPVLNGALTNIGGTIQNPDGEILGNGPIVMMSLLDCVTNEDDEDSAGLVGFFTLAYNMDGICENKDCDEEG